MATGNEALVQAIEGRTVMDAWRALAVADGPAPSPAHVRTRLAGTYSMSSASESEVASHSMAVAGTGSAQPWPPHAARRFADAAWWYVRWVGTGAWLTGRWRTALLAGAESSAPRLRLPPPSTFHFPPSAVSRTMMRGAGGAVCSWKLGAGAVGACTAGLAHSVCTVAALQDSGLVSVAHLKNLLTLRSVRQRQSGKLHCAMKNFCAMVIKVLQGARNAYAQLRLLRHMQAARGKAPCKARRLKGWCTLNAGCFAGGRLDNLLLGARACGACTAKHA